MGIGLHAPCTAAPGVEQTQGVAHSADTTSSHVGQPRVQALPQSKRWKIRTRRQQDWHGPLRYLGLPLLKSEGFLHAPGGSEISLDESEF